MLEIEHHTSLPYALFEIQLNTTKISFAVGNSAVQIYYLLAEWFFADATKPKTRTYKSGAAFWFRL